MNHNMNVLLNFYMKQCHVLLLENDRLQRQLAAGTSGAQVNANGSAVASGPLPDADNCQTAEKLGDCVAAPEAPEELDALPKELFLASAQRLDGMALFPKEVSVQVSPEAAACQPLRGEFVRSGASIDQSDNQYEVQIRLADGELRSVRHPALLLQVERMLLRPGELIEVLLAEDSAAIRRL